MDLIVGWFGEPSGYTCVLDTGAMEVANYNYNGFWYCADILGQTDKVTTENTN